MKTTVYFIRHAQSDHNHQGDDSLKPLTEKGLADTPLVTAYLEGVPIDGIYSSPYKRCLETLDHFVKQGRFEVTTLEGLRERKVGVLRDSDGALIDFSGPIWTDFTKAQWSDFAFKNEGGESLEEVQARNIAALKEILAKEEGNTIVVGTHGTAFSTIMNYYDNNFLYDGFHGVRYLLPFGAKVIFEEGKMLSYEITALAE